MEIATHKNSRYWCYACYCVSMHKAGAGWRTSPESFWYTILTGWRLSARLSLIWYTFLASSIFAQSLSLFALLCLCLKSIPRLEKIRLQSSLVHLKPMRQDELGNALLISNETTNIPSNRNACNGVKRRSPQMHHSQRFLKFNFTLLEMTTNQRQWQRSSWYKSETSLVSTLPGRMRRDWCWNWLFCWNVVSGRETFETTATLSSDCQRPLS